MTTTTEANYEQITRAAHDRGWADLVSAVSLLADVVDSRQVGAAA